MSDTESRALVVNFNAPELNHLASWLAQRDRLAGFVRPYVNKGRAWERALARTPGLRSAWAGSFGRRTLGDARLAALAHEAGVAGDVAAALIARLPLAPRRRLSLATAGHEYVRRAVAREGARRATDADAVVAYVGFARAAFVAARAAGRRTVLDYPIAHHRHHRRVRLEELQRVPAFADSWPAFDDWPDGYEAQIDAEIELADVVLVGSRYVRDSFVAQGVDAARIVVAEYGVDVDTFVPTRRPRAGRFEVVYAGQIGQRKGVSYLLDAYRAFAKPDSGLTLIGSIAGPPTPLVPYRELFRHVPHLTRPQLAARLAAADVFVFPSLIEGLPLVVLEAMACGLPVIVTANGPGDVVRDGVDGYLVPERDPRAIVERLEMLYASPTLRATLGANARRRALEFQWPAFAAKVARVLDPAMERAPRVAGACPTPA